MANLIFDDSRSEKLTTGETWSRVTEARFFEGSSIWPAFSWTENGDTGSYGSFTVNFDGTQISFFGNTPSAKASQNIFVSIDGRAPYNTSYGDTSPPTAVQWYQSPILSEGKHTINITHIAGTSLDYMVVAAGKNTPLLGQTLIVDDNDPAITYDGSWARNVGHFTLQDNPRESMPHGNATHQSSSQGSKATFVFSGQSVAVYSVFDYSRLGSVTVTYTIDDSVSQTKTHSVTPTTAEFRAGVLSRANVLLFSSDIAAGDHKLTMQVGASINQTPLVLDYILYTPSFATLASKPKLNPSSSSTSLGTGSTISSTGTSTGFAAGSTSGVNPGASTAPAATASKPPLVGAITGGVVGGAAVLALLLVLLLCRKRLPKRAAFLFTSSSPQPPGRSGLLCVEPFTSTAPSTTAMYNDTSQRKLGTPTFSAFRGTSTAIAMQHDSSRTGHGSDAASTGILDVPRSEISQHQSSLPVFGAVLTPVRRGYVQQEQDVRSVLSGDVMSTGAGTGTGLGGGVFRTRMQRLQALVTELNWEIEETGEEGVRVAELKGRIAELTREGEEREAEERERSLRERNRQSVATTVPPPYEPRRG